MDEGCCYQTEVNADRSEVKKEGSKEWGNAKDMFVSDLYLSRSCDLEGYR
jgi:hypothetical protein